MSQILYLGGISGSVITITGGAGGAISPDALGNITLAGGNNISTTGAGSTITIDCDGTILWSEVAGAAQAMAVNSGYILNNAGLVTATLPAVAAVGDILAVVGKGAGGWRIAQNAGQTIHFLALDTTPGIGGYLEFTNRYDCVELVCIAANTDFVVRSSVGNITVT